MIDHKSNYGQIGIRSGHCPLDSIFNCNWRLQYMMDSLDIQFHPLQKSHFNPIAQWSEMYVVVLFLIWEQLLTPLLLPNWTKTFFFFSPSREPEWEPEKIKIGLSARNRKGLGHFVQKKAFLVINYSGKFWWEARASIMEAAIATFQATNGEST